VFTQVEPAAASSSIGISISVVKCQHFLYNGGFYMTVIYLLNKATMIFQLVRDEICFIIRTLFRGMVKRRKRKKK
jgi:hypothetical protein